MDNHLRVIFLIMAFLLPVAVSGQGKWNGEVNLDAGTNFRLSPLKQKTHNLGDVSAKIGYDTKTFSFDVSGSGSYHHIQVGQVGRDFTIDPNGVTESAIKKVDSSVKEKTNTKTGAKVKLSWTPDAYNTFKAYYNYSHDSNTPNTYTFSTKNISEDLIDYTISSDMEDNMKRVHGVGASYKHKYDKPGRTLSAEIGATFGHTSNLADWATGDGSGKKIENPTDIPSIVQKLRAGLTDSLRYRINPYSDNRDISASILFSEPELAGVRNLDLDFSLVYRVKNLEDHSRASTLVNGVWRDSTSYRENFRFRTATLSPSLHIRYAVGIYSLDLTYNPEYFAQKLDSDGKIGDINKGRVAHLMKMTNTFKPWKGHQFVLGMRRSESRPDYLQICWFLRDGQYSNEKYRGNPDLQNSITTKSNLLYKFNYKRFSASLNTTYTYQPRKIAKTYDYETINGQECRVYTWINGGSSHEINENLSFSWKSEHFKANLSGQYTFYRGFSHKGSLTESSDYSIDADVEYCLNTWTFSLGGGYQSEVKRTYVSMTAIPTCDATISKSFGKHFSAFIEGRAILDKEVAIITESEDKTECREERIRYNNRLLVLGLSFKF